MKTITKQELKDFDLRALILLDEWEEEASNPVITKEGNKIVIDLNNDEMFISKKDLQEELEGFSNDFIAIDNKTFTFTI